MNKTLFTSLVSFALIFSTTGMVHAAFVIDEGLNNTGTNSAIGFSGKAANFVMGAGDDYQLTSVVLGIGNVNSGAAPIVQLWSDDGSGTPIGDELETLTLSGTFTADAANTFTSTGTTLSASTTYWIVVTNDNTNTFEWLGAANTSVTSDIGATHTARLFGGASPGSWNGTSGVLNQIQVNATVIPEPSTLALFGLAGVAMLVARCRKR
jgi:hypothetical protein